MEGNTARLADVNAEIAAAGAMHSVRGAIPASIKANNMGMIGVAVQSDVTGKECEFQVSLELYDDLDSVSLQTYLADAAKRSCASVRPGARFRIFQLPDSY
jgi:hypothetical protein